MEKSCFRKFSEDWRRQAIIANDQCAFTVTRNLCRVGRGVLGNCSGFNAYRIYPLSFFHGNSLVYQGREGAENSRECGNTGSIFQRLWCHQSSTYLLQTASVDLLDSTYDDVDDGLIRQQQQLQDDWHPNEHVPFFEKYLNSLSEHFSLVPLLLKHYFHRWYD